MLAAPMTGVRVGADIEIQEEFVELTQDFLRSILDYIPETGIFIWKYRSDRTDFWNETWVGKPAGAIVGNGRNCKIQIEISGKRYYAHRLAFLWVLGRWPEDQVDHKDGHGLHNWWDNLREANNSQNQANTDKARRGVFVNGNKFVAMIRVNGDLKYLGIYSNRDMAQQVYNEAADKYFGEFARCNRIGA
jgi:HNH endonuclease